MKVLPYYCLFFILTVCFTSCSTENIDQIDPDGIENPDNDPDPDGEEDEEVVTTDTPCDFDLSGIAANSTVNINCILDLKGETINLPANVNFDFDGGDIKNGTLVFSSGYIDGRILNSDLTIQGNATLKEPTFKFTPARWDNIQQGTTTSEIAQKNNTELENLMLFIKGMGGTTFEINNFDAYFEVSKVTSTTTNQNFYPTVESINVPSDFTLSMTDNTHLRVFPNSRKNYCLLGIREVSNVIVRGGNLHGDRPQHDDNSQEGPHAFGMVLIIHGATNVTVTGVRMVDGTGDGLDINGVGFTFQPDYKPSHNIRVLDCVFDNNRRNNLSITDGYDILVDGNTFLNAGVDNPGSIGMAPGFALDVEAFRGLENGEFIYYERAYDITISNNIERGSKYGAFIMAIGEDVIIENNQTEGVIGIGAASGIKIRGNTIVADPNDTTGAGITTGHPASETTFNNEVSNNTVRGYNIGIAAYQRDTEIFGNTLEDFGVGIQPKDIKNFNIYDNTFTSSKDNSIAIFGNLTTMENVNIYNNNVVSVGRESVKFVAVNEDASAANYKVTVENNDFANSGTFSRSNGIDFMRNRTKEGIIFVNAKNMTASENTIESTGQDGIIIGEGCSDLSILSNNITVIGNNLDCIDQQSGGTNINVTNNTCNN
ncbi:NosD domain-containing protein [Aquimarina sp. 2201CG14-23]|uniref:NosD domain-containing protein n=1 Tax=Aquimarina mycalae TaxID=3040073 RepID=UPI00247808A9|nr:NosD domain-containing protein [Aquimarina sp. 2201CG14-23]MDH7446566.1 right-handed parallel beta-helix repeat-containing protein [Aquimarina sp. 2201CG14-23]